MDNSTKSNNAGPPDTSGEQKGYYKEIMMKSKYSATGNKGLESL